MSACHAGRQGDGVLVVDDDVDLKELLADMLRGEGLPVTVASNGLEALETLRRGLTPCVILLDLMMPVMDGWQFRTRQLQDERLREIPTVIFTGVPNPGEEASAMAATAFLRKTAEPSEILDTVRRYC